MKDQLISKESQLQAVDQQIEALKDYRDPRWPTLARQQKELQKEIQKIKTQLSLEQKLTEAKDILKKEVEPELLKLAKQEIEQLKAQLEELEEVSTDQPSDQALIVEIRPGVGGEESSLFVGDLYRMYQRYVENQDWSLELLGEQVSPTGGFKEVIFRVAGAGALDCFRFEAGVHRVQRVPQTESQGRVHTSAVSVAVLPEVAEDAIVINQADLRIDTFRSSGHGGQSVNKTDSAVRLTHLPSGITVNCQKKSQAQNRQQALIILRARLAQRQKDDQQTTASSLRQSQIKQADRSQKIRTYNYSQDRVTDHRLGGRSGLVTTIIDGNLANLHQQLKAKETDG